MHHHHTTMGGWQYMYSNELHAVTPRLHHLSNRSLVLPLVIVLPPGNGDYVRRHDIGGAWVDAGRSKGRDAGSCCLVRV